MSADEFEPDNSSGAARRDSPVSGRERAVALQYAETDAVPRIVSTGIGATARSIIELAERSGVPIRRDPTLVDMLANVPAGAPIAPETYRVVAALIVFLYHADADFRSRHTRVGALLHAETPIASRVAADDEFLAVKE